MTKKKNTLKHSQKEYSNTKRNKYRRIYLVITRKNEQILLFSPMK